MPPRELLDLPFLGVIGRYITPSVQRGDLGYAWHDKTHSVFVLLVACERFLGGQSKKVRVIFRLSTCRGESVARYEMCVFYRLTASDANLRHFQARGLDTPPRGQEVVHRT